MLTRVSLSVGRRQALLTSLTPSEPRLHFVAERFNVDGVKCHLGRVGHNWQQYHMSADEATVGSRYLAERRDFNRTLRNARRTA